MQFDQENYTEEKQTIDIAQASNMGCTIMFPVFLFYGIPYSIIWAKHFSKSFFFSPFDIGLHFIWYLLLIFIVLILGVLLHEFIHGVFWAFFASKGFKSIRFGMIKEHFTPYCHCTEPLRVKHYIIGAIMPLIILGVFPAIWSWYNGNWLILLFGSFFTVAAIGDLLIIRLIVKLNTNDYVQDHPSEPGYFVYRQKKKD